MAREASRGGTRSDRRARGWTHCRFPRAPRARRGAAEVRTRIRLQARRHLYRRALLAGVGLRPSSLRRRSGAAYRIHHEKSCSMSTYEVTTTENVPIKAWTRGVPVEDAAMTQLRNAAAMPFIHKHIAVMPDV